MKALAFVLVIGLALPLVGCGSTSMSDADKANLHKVMSQPPSAPNAPSTGGNGAGMPQGMGQKKHNIQPPPTTPTGGGQTGGGQPPAGQ